MKWAKFSLDAALAAEREWQESHEAAVAEWLVRHNEWSAPLIVRRDAVIARATKLEVRQWEYLSEGRLAEEIRQIEAAIKAASPEPVRPVQPEPPALVAQLWVLRSLRQEGGGDQLSDLGWTETVRDALARLQKEEAEASAVKSLAEREAEIEAMQRKAFASLDLDLAAEVDALAEAWNAERQQAIAERLAHFGGDSIAAGRALTIRWAGAQVGAFSLISESVKALVAERQAEKAAEKARVAAISAKVKAAIEDEHYYPRRISSHWVGGDIKRSDWERVAAEMGISESPEEFYRNRNRNRKIVRKVAEVEAVEAEKPAETRSEKAEIPNAFAAFGL